jgi:hypothetical protein
MEGEGEAEREGGRERDLIILQWIIIFFSGLL